MHNLEKSNIAELHKNMRLRSTETKAKTVLSIWDDRIEKKKGWDLQKKVDWREHPYRWCL